MTVFDFFNQIVGFLAQTLPVVLLSRMLAESGVFSRRGAP